MSAKCDLCIAFRVVVNRQRDPQGTHSSNIRFTASIVNERAEVHSQGAPLLDFTLSPPSRRFVSPSTHVAENEFLLNSNVLAEVFLEVYRRFSHMDERSLRAVEHALLELSTTETDRRRRPWLEQARSILEEEFAEQPTLSALAGKVGVHPVHLAREFRRRYGSSVGEYVRKLRVEFACQQLLSSDDPPVKIATAAGFVDQSHFSRTFKQFLGTTPGKYRAALKTVYSLNCPKGSRECQSGVES